jgi:hypothetical protein
MLHIDVNPMNLLPPTHNKTLIVLVILGCTLLCCPLAFLILILLEGLFPGVESTGGGTNYYILFLLIPIVWLGVFILYFWRLSEQLRRFLTAIVIAAAFIVPFSIISAMCDMDEPIDTSMNSLIDIYDVLKVFAPFILALIYVYLLSRYRDDFRKRI